MTFFEFIITKVRKSIGIRVSYTKPEINTISRMTKNNRKIKYKKNYVGIRKIKNLKLQKYVPTYHKKNGKSIETDSQAHDTLS